MSDSGDIALELTRCVWCTSPLHGAEQSVTVHPPRGTESTFHEWELHLECAREWKRTVARLGRLKRLGAGAILLTAAEHDGIEALLSDGDLERLDAEKRLERESMRSDPTPQ